MDLEDTIEPRLEPLCPHAPPDPIDLCADCHEAFSRRSREYLRRLISSFRSES